MTEGRNPGLMSLKLIFLAFFGLCAGGVIAAGIFAFLAMIGVFPRLIGKSGTQKHIILYETLIILGGTLGNVMDLYEVPIVVPMIGKSLMVLFGLSTGVFVGCLVMSLAETLKAIPVMNRRIHLAVGIQYVILSIALGKMTGALIYFAKNLG